MSIVVKVGTGVLTREEDASLNEAALVRLVTELSQLIADGHKVVLVSSGAVGSGVSALKLGSYPSDLATRQACAAIGQTRLMHIYEALFLHFGICAAQLLLTAEDFKYREENMRNTLNWLLDRHDVIPVINENDTVAIEELKFGDNDMLSCLVAQMIGAEHLFLLTTVDGLYPPGGEMKEILHDVTDIDAVMSFADPDQKGKFSIGGMSAKLSSVQRAVKSGIHTYIANGAHPERIRALLAGEHCGTHFFPDSKS